MKTKTTKLLTIALGVATMTLTAGVVFSVGRGNEDVLRSSAEALTTSGGNITFDYQNSEVFEYDYETKTSTIITRTETGGRIVCIITNNYGNPGSGKIASLTDKSVIRFYEDIGQTEYVFEDLDIIRFYKGTTSFSFNLHYVYASGESDTLIRNSSTSNPRGVDFSDSSKYGNVSNIWIENTSVSTISLEKIEIIYNCTNKVQTGFEVVTEPSKLTYYSGRTFELDGTVGRIDYNNGTSVVTHTGFSYSPNRPLTVEDTQVTISYGGYSDVVDITVVEDDISGNYAYSSGDMRYYVTMNSDGTGIFRSEYVDYTPYWSLQHFKWEADFEDTRNIVFTRDDTVEDFSSDTGYHNLFGNQGSYQYTNDGTFSNNALNLKLVAPGGSRGSTIRSLTKQN